MARRGPEDPDRKPAVLPQLRQVLSRNYEAAKAELDAMFRAAQEEQPDNPYVARLEEWLSTVLDAEYFGRTPRTPERARPKRRLRRKRPAPEPRTMSCNTRWPRREGR